MLVKQSQALALMVLLLSVKAPRPTQPSPPTPHRQEIKDISSNVRLPLALMGLPLTVKAPPTHLTPFPLLTSKRSKTSALMLATQSQVCWP